MAVIAVTASTKVGCSSRKNIVNGFIITVYRKFNPCMKRRCEKGLELLDVRMERLGLRTNGLALGLTLAGIVLATAYVKICRHAIPSPYLTISSDNQPL